MCGIGAILIFLTIQGFLPEKLDAILHYEILFLGYFIGILGLFLVSRLMAYILIIFLIIGQIIGAVHVYSAYPF